MSQPEIEKAVAFSNEVTKLSAEFTKWLNVENEENKEYLEFMSELCEALKDPELEHADLNTTVISDIMDADFRISNHLTAAKLDRELESEVDAWARSHQVYLARKFQF